MLVSSLIYSSTLKMGRNFFSETSVDFQRTARRCIPEDKNIHNHSCENLKSYIQILVEKYEFEVQIILAWRVFILRNFAHTIFHVEGNILCSACRLSLNSLVHPFPNKNEHVITRNETTTSSRQFALRSALVCMLYKTLIFLHTFNHFIGILVV
jgi:hypothetical protein